MTKTVEVENHRSWAIKQADTVEGFMALDELAWLYDQAYGKCVEMGSYRGRSGTILGLKLKTVGGALSCIDCFNDSDYSIFQENLSKSDVSVNTLRMRSVEALDSFEKESLDFVFIDSSHEYDDTVDEIVGWLPKLKQDGILCGHDYGHPEFPGLTKAVHELCPGFQNPVGTIWCIDVSQFSDLQRQLFSVIHHSRQELASHLKHHTQEILELKGAVNHYSDTLAKKQGKLDALVEKQGQVKELRQELQNLKSSSKAIQRENKELQEEIVAIQSSKFWKLRSRWLQVKHVLGLDKN